METLPPQLAHLVDRCLAEDPGNRWQWRARYTYLVHGGHEQGRNFGFWRIEDQAFGYALTQEDPAARLCIAEKRLDRYSAQA